jgi:cellulose 1,4-beta-cellobiosidase
VVTALGGTGGGGTSGGGGNGGGGNGGGGNGGSGGGSGCTAAYSTQNDWGSGFTAAVTVTNNGSTPSSSWQVTWDWGGNQKVTNGWNATVTQSGSAVTARSMSYNGTIAAGASTSFGFQGTYTGTNSAPTLSCTLS